MTPTPTCREAGAIAVPRYLEPPRYDAELAEVMEQAVTALQRPGPDQIATARKVVFMLNEALSRRTMP